MVSEKYLAIFSELCRFSIGNDQIIMNTWKNRNVNMYKLFKKIFVEIIGNIFEFKVNCLKYRYNYKKNTNILF